MGFLKKITRPISRVLDKIVPNEIKPALPFLAAAAPFMAPGIMGAFGNSMLSRGLISGGLNLGSQLAQEGSDGDFSGLSTLMAAATGALSTPRGTDFSMSGPGEGPMTSPSAADFFKNKAAGMEPGFAKSGLGALEGTSNYLTGVSDTLQNNLFSKEGLKAALVPIGQGTTDLAIAEARRAQKDYERDMADAEAEQGASDAQRAAAIRQSMEAYGFTEEEIEDAIYAAGYKAGGRVGFEFGGIPAAVEGVEEKPKEFLVDKLKVTVQPGQSEEMGILNAMFNDTDGVMSDERKMEFYKLYIPQLYRRGEISEEVYEGMKEDIFGEGKAEGGRIGLQQGGVLAQILPQASQITTLTQQPLLAGLQPLQQAEAVFPRLNQLEQGVNRAEETLGRIRSRLGPEQKAQIAGFQPTLQPALGYQPLNMLNLNRGMGISALQSGPEAQGMKDGGMMDFGGREMDMRTGGFIPIGKKERADDVPARLSKNEFVMTADAVRAAGGGSVNKGAKRMYDLMNNLEARV